ncbi:MAG TPA: hypothetical protein VGA40_08295 [Candidatus Acidoferrales bacterium]
MNPRGDPAKLRLGENHRRALTVLLAGLEEMCDEMESWMERPPGVLLQVEDKLRPAQQEKLRALAARLREQLARVGGEVQLDGVVQSPRRSVLALLSAHIIYLEEAEASGFKGYGPLPEDARRRITAELRRLRGILEEMQSAARRA